MVVAFLSWRYFKILIARLAPSIGSVPEPNSSNNIKLDGVKFFSISTIVEIWAEKVLKDSWILCLSPISTKILSNI